MMCSDSTGDRSHVTGALGSNPVFEQNLIRSDGVCSIEYRSGYPMGPASPRSLTCLNSVSRLLLTWHACFASAARRFIVIFREAIVWCENESSVIRHTPTVTAVRGRYRGLLTMQHKRGQLLMIKRISSGPGLPAGFPFSLGSEQNGTLHVSGMPALDSDGKFVPGTFATYDAAAGKDPAPPPTNLRADYVAILNLVSGERSDFEEWDAPGGFTKGLLHFVGGVEIEIPLLRPKVAAALQLHRLSFKGGENSECLAITDRSRRQRWSGWQHRQRTARP
jgi:hypothetical protein